MQVLRRSRLRCAALFLRNAILCCSNAHLSGASLCHCPRGYAIPGHIMSVLVHCRSSPCNSTAPRCPSYLRISGAYHVSSGPFRFLAIRSNAFSAQFITPLLHSQPLLGSSNLFLYKANRIYTIPEHCLSSHFHCNAYRRFAFAGHVGAIP